MAKKFKIKGKMIVGCQDGEHRILRDGCIVIGGNTIVHVGKSYHDPVDEVIDAGNRLITPGLINTHAHLHQSPLDTSFIEDIGKRQFHLSSLPYLLPARGASMDAAAEEACVDYSMDQLIRTGTTTVMEIGPIGDYVADAVEEAGLRAYIANGYRSARWFTRDCRTVAYEWDEKAGIEKFHHACEFIERIDGRANGRIRGFLSPGQVDTCTEELLRMSRKASDEMQVPLALHTAQSVYEFFEIVKRHGLTPVEWLESINFLGEWCILGHVHYIAGNSWVQFAGDDLSILARNSASVAHDPWVFNREGEAMESFPAYLDAGVNVCLAADSSPQSMINSMRWASVMGKIMIRQTEKSTAADAFNAATLNAAKMLHREDLGRIAPGAKADLLFWDIVSLNMVPLRDPIKNIVFNATHEDLKDVMIDGRWVMQDKRVLTIDEETVCRNLQAAGERSWAAMTPGDWGGDETGDWFTKQAGDEISPHTYRDFEE